MRQRISMLLMSMTFYASPLFLLLSIMVLVNPAIADKCTYKYWEVIPSLDACEVLHLPDFDIRQVPPEDDAPEFTKRFCTNFEVASEGIKQKTGTCYTGEGDVTGPTFEVKGRKFLLDLSRQICVDDKPAAGIVFVDGDWKNSPSNIRRLWPVEALPNKVSCASKK